MNKLSAIAIVAALALPVGGLAHAEDATVKAGAAVGAAASGATVGADVDATATSSVNNDNYGTLISTLNAGKGLSDLSGITADADVSIVFVSSLEASGNAQALDNALEKNAGAMATLHASLESNAALKAKLDAEKIMIEDVVAVTTSTDGKVTVYVDDRA